MIPSRSASSVNVLESNNLPHIKFWFWFALNITIFKDYYSIRITPILWCTMLAWLLLQKLCVDSFVQITPSLYTDWTAYHIQSHWDVAQYRRCYTEHQADENHTEERFRRPNTQSLLASATQELFSWLLSRKTPHSQILDIARRRLGMTCRLQYPSNIHHPWVEK